MAYIDGYAFTVDSARRAEFTSFCESVDTWFLENGALRVVETWGEEVPRGKATDFHRAVAAREDETVCFSWIEWPDRATRDAAMERMGEAAGSDPRLDPEANPPPFDGARMIFGSFTPVFDRTATGT
ncbi:MAG: DUF1428 domain-containing protein [Erythrobacter sp.]